MKYPTIFDLIATEFKKAGIDFLLIGGFAVNAYKYSRNTGDIDFMIAEEDAPQVAQLLKNMDFQEFDRGQNFIRLRGSGRYPYILDLVFTNRPTLTKMIHEGSTKEIAGCQLPVPSLDHLIAMKFHAIKQQPERREWKDWIDILELIRVNKIDVKADSFRELCLKFGTPELYERILENAPKTENQKDL